MKKQCPLFFFPFLALLAQACGSSNELNGQVFHVDGTVAPFAAIKLIAIDDRGQELFVAGESLADGYGRYTLLTALPKAANLVVEAKLPGGALRGFAGGRGGDTPIHPLTDALVEIITDITSPSGGRTLSDFSPEEIRDFTREVMAIDPNGLNFSDGGAIKQAVLDKVGRALAVASGAQLAAATSASVQPSGSLVPDIVMTNDSPFCPGTNTRLFSSADFTFDLTSRGKVCDGYSALINNAFNDGFAAQITNDTFVDNGTSDYPDNVDGSLQQVISIFADRTAVFMPKLTTNGITLQRKVFVPTTGNWARYLEILKNTAGAARTVDFRAQGEVGSSITTFMLVRGENDPPALSASDRFAASAGNFAQFPAPTVGFVWQDNNAGSASSIKFAEAGNADNFTLAWNAIEIPAGQTRTLLYYTLLTASRDPEAVRSALREIADHPDMQQMYSEELAGLQNFAPAWGNIAGQAGAVAEGATITATNARTGVTVSGKARRDWSFYLSLEAVSGDTIALTASDGLATSLFVK